MSLMYRKQNRRNKLYIDPTRFIRSLWLGSGGPLERSFQYPLSRPAPFHEEELLASLASPDSTSSHALGRVPGKPSIPCLD